MTNLAQWYWYLHVVDEFFLNSKEVHWFLDDFSVSRDRLALNWAQKGPCILMGLQLSQQHSERKKQLVILFLSSVTFLNKILWLFYTKKDKCCMFWMCMYIPTHSQLTVRCFGPFCTGDKAVKPRLRAVFSFPLFELLGTSFWHVVAAGNLLTDKLSLHRWLTVLFYLTAFMLSSSCLVLLLPIGRDLTTFLNDGTQKILGDLKMYHLSVEN